MQHSLSARPSDWQEVPEELPDESSFEPWIIGELRISERLSIPTKSVRALCRRGGLPAIELFGQYYVRPADLRRWLDAKFAEAAR